MEELAATRLPEALRGLSEKAAEKAEAAEEAFEGFAELRSALTDVRGWSVTALAATGQLVQVAVRAPPRLCHVGCASVFQTALDKA